MLRGLLSLNHSRFLPCRLPFWSDYVRMIVPIVAPSYDSIDRDSTNLYLPFRHRASPPSPLNIPNRYLFSITQFTARRPCLL